MTSTLAAAQICVKSARTGIEVDATDFCPFALGDLLDWRISCKFPRSKPSCCSSVVVSKLPWSSKWVRRGQLLSQEASHLRYIRCVG